MSTSKGNASKQEHLGDNEGLRERRAALEAGREAGREAAARAKAEGAPAIIIQDGYVCEVFADGKTARIGVVEPAQSERLSSIERILLSGKTVRIELDK